MNFLTRGKKEQTHPSRRVTKHQSMAYGAKKKENRLVDGGGREGASRHREGKSLEPQTFLNGGGGKDQHIPKRESRRDLAAKICSQDEKKKSSFRASWGKGRISQSQWGKKRRAQEVARSKKHLLTRTKKKKKAKPMTKKKHRNRSMQGEGGTLLNNEKG